MDIEQNADNADNTNTDLVYGLSEELTKQVKTRSQSKNKIKHK